MPLSITMPLSNLINSPAIWILAGLAVGVGLGVTSASVWLLLLGLVLFIIYLRLHGPAQNKTEGRLFSAGPAFVLSWLVGFVIHSLAF